MAVSLTAVSDILKEIWLPGIRQALWSEGPYEVAKILEQPRYVLHPNGLYLSNARKIRADLQEYRNKLLSEKRFIAAKEMQLPKHYLWDCID